MEINLVLKSADVMNEDAKIAMYSLFKSVCMWDIYQQKFSGQKVS